MPELIVRYTGDIKGLAKEIGFLAEELLGGYAIVRIATELAPLLLSSPEILWTEVPSRVYTEVTGGRRASCVTALQAREPTLTGRGVLVAIIDSGIDYRHPDFRKEDGSTRIAALWDQTATGEVLGAPPEGYLDGILYTRERINEALPGAGNGMETGEEESGVRRTGLVPEEDLSGHGTHVAGIAAGNGRASGGRYRGVAYESDLLVVKLGGSQSAPFPQTTNLMEAVDFCVRYGAEAGQPVAINLSFGNNAGAHDGKSLLETYLDTAALYGRNCICIGTGNNGALGWHAGGRLGTFTEERLLSVASAEKELRLGLWLNSLDEAELELEAPDGRVQQIPFTGAREGTAVKGYPAAAGIVLMFGDYETEVFMGEATPYRMLREIGITLRKKSGIMASGGGIWRIRLRPVRILDGTYDIWIVGGVQSDATRFLQATPERTLTIPSTAAGAVAVAAYDGRTDGIAGFSGRGYPRGETDGGGVKPDVAAPGVEIVSCAPGGGYTTKSGTSMATPFVTGSAALLMQWGIVEGNDPYLYGERLKSFLIRGAKPLPGVTEYPNPYVGWGTVCVSESYDLLRYE